MAAVCAACRSAHILDLDEKRWYDVTKAFEFAPRAGHTVVYCEAEDSLLFWGGGDNDAYFSDMHAVPLATITALCVH
eukprot:m.311280 g.311280  ORF g.311280 m.311280 type:complete len:77 (+) comp27446_c0_seq1:1501-1731(+)